MLGSEEKKHFQAFSIPLILTCSLTRSSSSCSQVLHPKSSSCCLCIYRNPYSERASQLICLRHAKISEANKIKKTNKFFTFHRPVLLLCCSRMALLYLLFSNLIGLNSRGLSASNCQQKVEQHLVLNKHDRL